MRRRVVKKVLVVLLFLVGLSGCVAEGSSPSAPVSATTATSSSTTLMDLETWCPTQTPDRCVEGLVYLDANPERQSCVFTAVDDSLRFWELCDEGVQGGEPGTTVPTEVSEAERLAAEQEYKDELARRLPALDERAIALLAIAHPDGIVTAGLIFVDPMDLSAVEQVAGGQGAVLIAAWRTDYLCFPGIDDWPIDTASRFAYLDGVERAERLQEEMQNSTTPVTGAQISLDAFAVMEQEAIALRQPGVLLEAVHAEVPVSALESLRNDPHVGRLRLADFPTEWIDLTDLPVPACESG